LVHPALARAYFDNESVVILRSYRKCTRMVLVGDFNIPIDDEIFCVRRLHLTVDPRVNVPPAL
jgi:hypothetical protein